MLLFFCFVFDFFFDFLILFDCFIFLFFLKKTPNVIPAFLFIFLLGVFTKDLYIRAGQTQRALRSVPKPTKVFEFVNLILRP